MVMGLHLDCPLCCSETFSCHNSLKYHLLSVIDNLLCPACQKRFDNVFELSMHLGRQCEDEMLSGPEIKTNASKATGAEVEDADSDFEFVVCDKPPKRENCVETDVCMYREASPIKSDTNENEQLTDDQFYCSTCTTYFTSFEEHVEKFHSGEEIFLALSTDGKEDTKMSTNETEGEEDEDEEEKEINSNQTIKSPRLLDTVQEEECVDKDGRLYTRKIVKIEKFWNDSEIHGPNDNVAKLPYVVNHNGLLQRIIPIDEDNKMLEIYECSKCEIKFLSVSQYEKHKCCGEHKMCNICNSQFANLKFLKAHKKSHGRKKVAKCNQDPNVPFKCEICNTEFSTSKSLRLHRRMHEPIKSKEIEPPSVYGKEGEQLRERDAPRKMFRCQICNKSYDQEYEEAHNQYHSKDVHFNCEVCNRKFNTQENLGMHMNAHTDVKKFLCPNCKKPFLTEEKLDAHKSAECEKRQYECRYCGRRFTRPHEKVKHERIHTGEKPHICAICGKAFRVSYCLTLHLRTHSGTRPYQCEICGKRFKAHSVYAHHLKTHSDNRKYKCTFCPKSFKTGVQLAGHRNSHIKPFNCTECNRPFASLYAVRAHMETHQRQNNLKYNCWLCGASYARAFALRDHFKEQHVGEIGKDVNIETLMLDPEGCKIEGPGETQENVLIDMNTDNVINTGKRIDCFKEESQWGSMDRNGTANFALYFSKYDGTHYNSPVVQHSSALRGILVMVHSYGKHEKNSLILSISNIRE